MGKYRRMQAKRISTFSSQLSVDPEYWTGPAPGIKHLTSRSAYMFLMLFVKTHWRSFPKVGSNFK